MNPTFTKNYTAGAAIAKRRFVKIGAADGAILQAAAATDPIIGASTDIDAASGDRVDAHLAGIVEVEAGGNITRGVQVTADADGKAVAAAPASGVNNFVAGRAMVSAAAGDIIPVLLAIAEIQGE